MPEPRTKESSPHWAVPPLEQPSPHLVFNLKYRKNKKQFKHTYRFTMKKLKYKIKNQKFNYYWLLVKQFYIKHTFSSCANKICFKIRLNEHYYRGCTSAPIGPKFNYCAILCRNGHFCWFCVKLLFYFPQRYKMSVWVSNERDEELFISLLLNHRCK